MRTEGDFLEVGEAEAVLTHPRASARVWRADEQGNARDLADSIPDIPEMASIWASSSAKSLTAGLGCRPIAETVADPWRALSEGVVCGPSTCRGRLPSGLRARVAPLSAPPSSYTVAVERYLTGAGIATSSARIYRISLTTWG